MPTYRFVSEHRVINAPSKEKAIKIAEKGYGQTEKVKKLSLEGLEMKYEVLMTEKIYDSLILEASSEEEANYKALVAVAKKMLKYDETSVTNIKQLSDGEYLVGLVHKNVIVYHIWATSAEEAERITEEKASWEFGPIDSHGERIFAATLLGENDDINDDA